MTRANGKMTQKYAKLKKMAKNHFSRSDFGSWGGFLGVFGASLYWKVDLEFWFGLSKCHFWYPQNGQSNPFSKFYFGLRYQIDTNHSVGEIGDVGDVGDVGQKVKSFPGGPISQLPQTKKGKSFPGGPTW